MISSILIIVVVFLGIVIFGLPLLHYLNVPLSDEFNMWTSIVRSFVEAVAVVVAGYWTYYRFVNEDSPYPKLTHKVESYRLDNGILYLCVIVAVNNQGKRNFSIGAGKVIVRQISPITNVIKDKIYNLISEGDAADIITGEASGLFVDSGQRLALDTIGVREWKSLSKDYNIVTPGQSREIQFVFLVNADADVIEIGSNIEANKSNWELSTLHSLTQDKSLV